MAPDTCMRLALGSKATAGSVCTGIGGLDLGFHNAGWDVAWQCEFDPWRRKMLAHRWPGTPCHPDLAELDPADLAPVAVLIGGTPCQNFSQAGNRKGLAGAKSSLFHHYMRIRDAIQPEYSVWENVVGALSTNGGRDFAAVLGAFVGSPVTVPSDGWDSAGVAVGDGGWAVWRILDAQWFGVAQRRRRVIVVASTRAEPAPEVLLEPEGMRWDPPTRRGSRSTVAIDAGAGVGNSGPEGGAVARCLTTSGFHIDADVDTFVVGALTTAGTNGGWRIGADEAAANHIIPVAATLTSGSSNPGVSAPGRRQEDDVNLVPVVSNTLRTHPWPGSDCFDVVVEAPATSPTLTSAGHDSSEDGTNRHALVAFNWRGDDYAPEGREHVPTLDADESGSVAVHEHLNVRRLTPLEYERLQGFPDGWTIDPDLGDKTPDSRRYSACGDAVAVPVAQWIATRLMEVVA